MAQITVYAAADHRAGGPLTAHWMAGRPFFTLEPPLAESVLVLYAPGPLAPALTASVWPSSGCELVSVGSVGPSRAVVLDAGKVPPGVLMVCAAADMPLLQTHLVGDGSLRSDFECEGRKWDGRLRAGAAGALKGRTGASPAEKRGLDRVFDLIC